MPYGLGADDHFQKVSQMSELHHECGVAAVYHLPGSASPLVPDANPAFTSQLIVRMLQDMQNRGQLSAGISRYNPTAENHQLIDTYRDIGSVQEVFRLSHGGKATSLMEKYSGVAAIGHVRYATCGENDKSYAQPFENHHFHRRQWFSFAFNGQLANYRQLEDELLGEANFHLVRKTDTEVLLYQFCKYLQANPDIPLDELMRAIADKLDGAYSLALLNANGEMLVARDALGIKPLCYAVHGPLFAAASESVALANLGFPRDSIRSVEPGQAIVIRGGQLSFHRFAEPRNPAHCFFEWIYFANVASTMDDRSVYLTRTALGKELADLERQQPLFPIDDDTIIVPVPDTSKAAADSMAFQLKIPCVEGLIRNRYSGRTFIEHTQAARTERARIKYTPLREVLHGKRVILVEDSIVRSTTMKALLERIWNEGGAREIHVRIACPPIIAPCFYGIDMSSVRQLFAARFVQPGQLMNPHIERQMATELGATTLRYLPVEAIARSLQFSQNQLCQACISGRYPTPVGQQLYQLDRQRPVSEGEQGMDERAYESRAAAAPWRVACTPG
ncbi:MAG TPA: amidophosphoribosyltransferase [Pirellulaceae bacterium]|nr:amidophosphoribosyltransferase [Pirellulaceae bacterium]